MAATYNKAITRRIDLFRTVLSDNQNLTGNADPYTVTTPFLDDATYTGLIAAYPAYPQCLMACATAILTRLQADPVRYKSIAGSDFDYSQQIDTYVQIIADCKIGAIVAPVGI